MTNMPLKVIDVAAAVAILISLYFVKEIPAYWLLYSFGCIAFVYIGIKKKIYGLAVLNAVAIIIGIKNFFL